MSGEKKDMVAELNAAIMAILAPGTATPDDLAALFHKVFDYLWESLGAVLPTGTVRELLPTADIGLDLQFLPLEKLTGGNARRIIDERPPSYIVLPDALTRRVFGPVWVSFTPGNNIFIAVFLTRDGEVLVAEACFELAGMAYNITNVDLRFYSPAMFEVGFADKLRTDRTKALQLADGIIKTLEKAVERMLDRIRESERRLERIANATVQLRAVPAALAHLVAATPPTAPTT